MIGLHPIQESINTSNRLMPWKSELIAEVISYLGLETDLNFLILLL